MIFALLISSVISGPIDWLATDLNIAESGIEFIERKSPETYQVGLGVDFPVPVQVGIFRQKNTEWVSLLGNLLPRQLLTTSP